MAKEWQEFVPRKRPPRARWIVLAAIAGLGASALPFIINNSREHTALWFITNACGSVIGGVILTVLLVRLSRIYKISENDKRILEDEALGLLQETRAARYREDRVRRIIENAADAYIEVGSTGLVQAWNSKAAEMFGWSSDEAIERRFVELIMPPEGQGELDEFIEQFWTDEERFDGTRAELIAANRFGGEFPVEVTVWIDESGLQPQMSFFLRDITLRREADERLVRALEEERRAVQRLQELDRAKTDFVSSVSHELRSPLTSTLGFLELLAEGDAGALTPEQSRMIEIASRNAKRLFGLIEDLLTLSKIEEGAFRVSFKPVRIDQLIHAVIEHNTPMASERNISLELDVEGHLGVCPGDEQQLLRAIGNIVGNAVKFTPDDGHVKVSVRREREEVVVVVSDTGIGIPSDEQIHLFNRFFRASVAIEKQHTGTGLGLTIAKAIIDHHGGSINISSRVGFGTDVTVRCPALPVDEHSTETVEIQI